MISLDKILCPVDFTEVSQRELALASALALRFEAELVVQHNLAFGAGLGVSWMHEREEYEQNRVQEEAARKKLASVLDSLPEAVRARARGAITYGALHHDVEQLALGIDAGLIVIGTHARGDHSRQSEALRLATRAPCPVLTTRDDAPHEWMPALDSSETISTIVPVDMSPHSLRALRYAAELQWLLPLDLLALYVTDRDDRGPEWLRDRILPVMPELAPGGIDFEVVHGRAVDQILLEERFSAAGLVVMGTHTRGILEKLFSGRTSTAEQVMQRSSCPVWFVPESARV